MLIRVALTQFSVLRKMETGLDIKRRGGVAVPEKIGIIGGRLNKLHSHYTGVG